MRRPRPVSVLAAAVTTAVALVLMTGSAGAATPPVRSGATPAVRPNTGVMSSSAGRRLPAHIFAPYFEAYTDDNPATLSRQSGSPYLTMAFIQTATAGSCTPYWNGDTSQPIAPASFGAEIAQIQAHGGDVIPSFGGFSADDTGTEIADSCTSVAAIARVYEKVITTYHVTRLDLDTEDNSLTNTAGIDRRNKAIALVDKWAAAHHRLVQFVYTLPVSTEGLEDTGVAILANAKANHARVDIVNIMTFDYYDDAPHEMAADTRTAAAGLHAQLHALYPHRSSASLWHMTGVTEMVGIDDFGPPEIFTTSDAVSVQRWAAAKGLAELSFWALERDNGACPGTAGSDNCSGVSQHRWQFSHTFEHFTR